MKNRVTEVGYTAENEANKELGETMEPQPVKLWNLEKLRRPGKLRSQRNGIPLKFLARFANSNARQIGGSDPPRHGWNYILSSIIL